jgi:hypothetical protein
MRRREFFRVSGMCLLAFPVLRPSWPAPGGPPGPRESAVWIHGSPYLGHSDFRASFRGLSPEGIKREIVHFRTAEPWRRKVLFAL